MLGRGEAAVKKETVLKSHGRLFRVFAVEPIEGPWNLGEESGRNSWGTLSRQRWKVSQEQKITYGKSDKRFQAPESSGSLGRCGRRKEGLQIFRELENHIFKSVDYTLRTTGAMGGLESTGIASGVFL